MIMDVCCVGKILNDACHLTTRIKRHGLILCHEFEEDDIECIKWRAGIEKESVNTICLHHEDMYGKGYRKSRMCCDIFKRHNKKITGDRDISYVFAKKLINLGYIIEPGNSFCRNCEDRAKAISEEASNDVTSSAASTAISMEMTNESLSALGASPLNTHCMRVRTRSSYVSQKVSQTSQLLNDTIKSALGLEVSRLPTASDDVHQDSADLMRLMKLLKEKVNISSCKEKIK